MKLNIGSAEPSGRYKRDWINIEYCHTIKNIKKHNLVFGDGCNMPFKNNCFELIHCIHMMEHVDRRDHPSLLNEIIRTLKPKGQVYIEVPNFIKVCENIVNLYKDNNLNELREQIRCWTLSVYGKGRYNGDTHRWGFYPELLKEDMEKVGLEVSFPTENISNHWKQEPVILICGTKP